MNALFDSLNEQQVKAVKATEGRVRIIAGAGSGKTRVIAHRYAYLVNELGIDPGNILCMTFTNKAAQEMKHRISGLVPAGYVNDFVCTIHGFCVKFLRQEIHRLGFPKTFTILDEEDAKSLAKKVMTDMHIDRTKSTVKKHLNLIGRTKGSMGIEYVGKYLLPHSTEAPAADQQFFYNYLQEQIRLFALDFDDLIHFTLYILQQFSQVRTSWQQHLNYVQIDEVQDCSVDEWQLFSLLSGGFNNLCVVGDPDQAIYEWRGSKPSMFVDFVADTDIVLNQNYRSTPNILDVANAVISNNKHRVPKHLFTLRPTAAQVLHYHAKSDGDECEWIAGTISKLKKHSDTKYGDMAVLFRSSFLMRGLEQELIRKGVPYSVWGGVRFFERKEIKDAIAYLRLIANPDDDMAFLRVCNVPSRKFGKKRLESLVAMAENGEQSLSLYSALKLNIDDAQFRSTGMQDFVKVIEESRQLFKNGCGVGSTLDHVLTKTQLKDIYRTDEDEDRLENINELLHSIKEFEAAYRAEEETSILNDYLQEVALFTNADFRHDPDTVKLMTIHQAKGLEFPFVFVMGLNEGIFPSHRSIRERLKAAEEEERRLMYVAITRAEQRLFLTESEGFSPNLQCAKFPSRFLAEIPSKMVEVEGRIPKDIFWYTKEMVRNLNDELGIPNPKKPSEGTSSTTNKEEQFYIGDKVKHSVFGIGVVRNVKPNGSCEVEFKGGARSLVPRVLTKI